MTSFEKRGSLFLPSHSTLDETSETQIDDEELSLILEGFVDVIDSAKGSSIIGGDSDDRVLDAEGVLLKVAYHCLSAVALSHGTSFRLNDRPINFLDPASIKVICRSAFESVITFHFVFAAPNTQELRDCRYLTWVINGFLSRQKFQVNSELGKKRIKEDAEYINSQQELLQKNPIFLQYEPEFQKAILRDGLWRMDLPRSDGKQPSRSIAWWAMGEMAGFEAQRMMTTYKYLSQYSHATSLSVLQIRLAREKVDREKIVRGTLSQLKEVLSVGIVHWCSLFEASRAHLEKSSKLKRKVKMWSEIAKLSFEGLPD